MNVVYAIYVYGSICVALMLIIYSFIRSKHPNLYDPKANNRSTGHFWILSAFAWSEEELLEKVKVPTAAAPAGLPVCAWARDKRVVDSRMQQPHSPLLSESLQSA